MEFSSVCFQAYLLKSDKHWAVRRFLFSWAQGTLVKAIGLPWTSQTVCISPCPVHVTELLSHLDCRQRILAGLVCPRASRRQRRCSWRRRARRFPGVKRGRRCRTSFASQRWTSGRSGLTTMPSRFSVLMNQSEFCGTCNRETRRVGFFATALCADRQECITADERQRSTIQGLCTFGGSWVQARTTQIWRVSFDVTHQRAVELHNYTVQCGGFTTWVAFVQCGRTSNFVERRCACFQRAGHQRRGYAQRAWYSDSWTAPRACAKRGCC